MQGVVHALPGNIDATTLGESSVSAAPFLRIISLTFAVIGLITRSFIVLLRTRLGCDLHHTST